MAVQYIEIGSERDNRQPIVKLAESSPGSIWQYMGTCIGVQGNDESSRKIHDLNCAAEAAAASLAEKVSRRNIQVELLIDPLIPPMSVEMERVVPILTAIAENASASVEPGPGFVRLKTWCTDKFAGMDAIGRNGFIPNAVRESWTLPGFSTRVADWDTGFGLHAAIEAADAIAGKIELIEQRGAVAFRLALPLNIEAPLPSAEAMVGISEPGEPGGRAALSDNDVPSYTLLGLLGGLEDVREQGIIQA